jgi:hypothetical protein
MVTPTGGGNFLHDARSPAGEPLDCTIHLLLLDGAGYPIVLFPREDLWLEWEEGLVGICPGGSVADQHTDLQGETRWTAPLDAGGWSEGNCRVIVNGEALRSGPGLPLKVNSPDLNGDGIVNLIDVTEFATDYFGAYAFRADLQHDGVVNLADVTKLAGAMGASCP